MRRSIFKNTIYFDTIPADDPEYMFAIILLISGTYRA